MLDRRMSTHAPEDDRRAELAAFLAWCRDAGLDLRATRGMTYNPITQRYALGDDTSVNYLVACTRPS